MAAVSQNVGLQLEHITKEMYKKNLELARQNKILLLLRQIEVLILSTLNDIQTVSSELCKIIVSEAGFELSILYLANHTHTSLEPLSVAFSKLDNDLLKKAHRNLSSFKPSLTKGDNLLKKSFINKTIELSKDLNTFPGLDLDLDNITQIQSILKITEYIVYPLVVNGKTIGILTVGMGPDNEFDFDQQRKLLDSLQNIIAIALDNALLYATIEKANLKLKELDVLKDEFVSVASHELRTPMTAIKSYLWMALDGQGGPLTDKQKFYLERSYDSTDRLIKLVNNMLNISRIESGRISLELTSIDIVKLVNDVIDEVSPRAKELNINLAATSNNNLPKVIADGDKIKEVLINLIGNSFKFTPKNGTIKVDFQLKDDLVFVSVADTGAGLSPEMIQNLFQKFGLIKGSYKTNQTSTTQGTGLGLYICKQILKLHHGDISATSPGVGKGSVFTFSLPISTPAKLKLYQKDYQHNSEIGIIHSKI